MNRDYFQSLEKERLVEVADNLHQLAVEQWEKINSNSSNSSQPPSGDNPFQKHNSSSGATGDSSQKDSESTASSKKNLVQDKQVKESKSKRKPGRQKGSKGFGRSKPVAISSIIPHYPSHCSACNQAIPKTEQKPYMGHHVLELETTEMFSPSDS
jgi:transposase